MPTPKSTPITPPPNKRPIPNITGKPTSPTNPPAEPTGSTRPSPVGNTPPRQLAKKSIPPRYDPTHPSVINCKARIAYLDSLPTPDTPSSRSPASSPRD